MSLSDTLSTYVHKADTLKFTVQESELLSVLL